MVFSHAFTQLFAFKQEAVSSLLWSSERSYITPEDSSWNAEISLYCQYLCKPILHIGDRSSVFPLAGIVPGISSSYLEINKRPCKCNSSEV